MVAGDKKNLRGITIKWNRLIKCGRIGEILELADECQVLINLRIARNNKQLQCKLHSMGLNKRGICGDLHHQSHQRRRWQHEQKQL